MSVRNRPVARVKQARCPARLPSTGLELHEPLAQFGLGVFIKRRSDVLELKWVCGHVVDLHEHLREEGRGTGDQSAEVTRGYPRCENSSNLIVVEVAVLKVDRGGDGAHARIGVVGGVLTHAVGKTLLEETMGTQLFARLTLRDFLRVGRRTDTPGPSRGQAASDTLRPSPSYSTRKSVLQLLLFIFPS